jgi:hypothetical protein
VNLRQFIDRISAKLQGFTRDQDQQTYLTTSIDSDDLTFTVNEPKMITQGIAEIEEELVWIQRVDNSTGTVTIAPYGRGYLSTTAASHASNTAILNNPKYPRSEIHAAIDDAVDSVYPDLYTLANYEFPFAAARTAYEVPAAVDQVHRVTWESIGPTREWIPVTRWNFDPKANTTRFPSGKSLSLYQGVIPGRTVRVTYIKPPTKFSDYVTDFATATGLNSTAEDVIVYGACYRLVGFQESPRLQIQTIESQLRSQLVPPGSTMNAARHFYQLYQLALNSERERLLRQDPPSAHFRYV